jgi:cell division protein FtsL
VGLRPLILGAFFTIAAVCLLQVVQTSDATTSGYNLMDLERQRLDRQAQVHELEAEIAGLTSMQRIEQGARGRLGMVPPEQVLTLEVHKEPPAQQLVPQRYLTEQPPAEGSSWQSRLLRLLPFY